MRIPNGGGVGMISGGFGSIGGTQDGIQQGGSRDGISGGFNWIYRPNNDG